MFEWVRVSGPFLGSEPEVRDENGSLIGEVDLLQKCCTDNVYMCIHVLQPSGLLKGAC